MGKVGWRSGQHSVETATGTRTLIAGTEIKAMIPSVGRAGAVVATTLTTDGRRRGLYYRDRIRRGDAPEVGRTGRLLSPVPVSSVVVSLTTPTAHLLWTVIVEIPFSMAAAIFATPVVRVGHFDSVPPSCFFASSKSSSSSSSASTHTHSAVSVNCLRLRFKTIITLYY